jgi:hypothetical protein
MSKDRWKKFLSLKKMEYYSIGFVLSPALNMQKIYFNEKGYNHLLMKNNKYRTISEQRRKLKLLKYSNDIICTCQTIDEYNNINNAEYWSLSTTYGDNLITVIIRRINNKELHFYSIMDKKAHKPQ